MTDCTILLNVAWVGEEDVSMCSSTDGKTQPCLVCGAVAREAVRRGIDLCRSYPKIFTLARCTACGHVMQDPIPNDDELRAAYAVAAEYSCYRAGWQQHGWPLWKVLRSWTTRRRISQLKEHGYGRDLLEIGSGAGDFLVSAHRSGWKVKAVEYNESMAQLIRDRFQIEIRTGELKDDLWLPNTCDTVAFWNVLEHLQDPSNELRIAAMYLRPSGRVLLNIPTRQAAEAGRFFGQYWALLDIPRHIHFFDKKTLSRVCESVGLKLIEYKTPFVQSAWCYYASAWRCSDRRAFKVGRWIEFLTLAAVTSLLLPYIAIQALIGNGMEAFAVAEKATSS